MKKPMRMPPLRTLRVRDTSTSEKNPCITIMSSVLACWASAGYSSAGCATVEEQLRACMDGPKPPATKRNAINHHLGRFKKYLEGPTKHK